MISDKSFFKLSFYYLSKKFWHISEAMNKHTPASLKRGIEKSPLGEILGVGKKKSLGLCLLKPNLI
jgi:hypothetical protein